MVREFGTASGAVENRRAFALRSFMRPLHGTMLRPRPAGFGRRGVTGDWIGRDLTFTFFAERAWVAVESYAIREIVTARLSHLRGQRIGVRSDGALTETEALAQLAFRCSDRRRACSQKHERERFHHFQDRRTRLSSQAINDSCLEVRL